MKDYFNTEWGGTEGNYIHSYTKDGKTYNDFSKETTWFIAYKELAEGNERTDAFLDFIAESVGDGIGDTAYSPHNIEAYTYLPDAFFKYNEADTAWKYMQYIYSVKDEPHEIAVQGTNGNYPEIPFTVVSHTITGMMGVEPNAPENAVATIARLPQDINYVKASNIKMGEHVLEVSHNGLTESAMTNTSSEDLTWTVRFFGDYDYIQAGGQVYKAEKSDINGDAISYAVVTVPAGETVEAEVVAEESEADAAAAVEVSEKIDAIGKVTLESKDAIEAARTAYDALNDNAKAMVGNLDVLEAAEEKLAKLENPENPFTDVNEDAWYYNSVMYAYNNGLFYGTSDTTFEPNSPMTRGMLVQVLYRIDGRPEVSEDAPTFPDVNSAKYYANAISWAAEENLVSGYKDGTFGPENNITREQIAKILYRYAEYKGYDVTASQSLDGYKDADQVTEYAVKYLEWATAEGLIKGDDGELNPKGDATRAEISAILRRFIEKYE